MTKTGTTTKANGLKIGDILQGSWGYDQTNQEFWQVVGLTKSGKSVKVRKLQTQRVEGTEGFMSCSVLPLKDQFADRPRWEDGEWLTDSNVIETKRIQDGYNGNVSVKIHDHCYLSLWDGKPKYESWYH